MTRHGRLWTALLLAAATAAPAAAQMAGEIGGTVTDVQGLAVPGVAVTLAGPALIAPQTAVTLVDGSYRFRALGRGAYDLVFEIPGFRTLVREGVIVEGSRAIRIDAALELAAVAESVTVSGAAPVVDVKTTALVNDFGVEELQEVPSATDVWAVLGQTAGVRMRGFDVGGSHKSQQTEYESFGIRGQHRVLADGVDTTEGTGGTGFYFDYYSIEEFTTTAAGADVEMTSPGSLLLMTMKSGGNDFSGMYHTDYEPGAFVGHNVDEALASRGYTGNPNLLFFESHADLGGPIARDRAWFYGFYNHFRIDKAVSGVDRAVATDLGDFDGFGGKATVRLSNSDRLIGYMQRGLKQKPKRGLSADVGPDSVLAQDSWSWAYKAEWQRVWSDRTFMTAAAKHFGFGWPMVPQVDPALHPPRLDSATGRLSGAGWFPGAAGPPPFTFARWKPQATLTLNHYVPDVAGSHDFKLGYDFQVDSSQVGSNANSGHIRYLDDSANDRPFNVDRIMLYSMPAQGAIGSDDRNRHHAVFLQDTWRPTDRLSMNLGVRYEQQRTYFLDATSTPFFDGVFPTGTTAGRTNVVWNTLAPRLGVTFALAPQTVVKGHYGRYYLNLADAHAAANPGGTAWVRHAFLDPNANGLDVGFRQRSTNWAGRLLARYTLPAGIGLSTNIRHQSGWPYALIQRVDVPGTGTNQPVFLSDISANRSDNVTLVDIRVEKAVATGGRGRLTLMADAYNLLNSNAVTNFSLRVGDDERVIAALDPIALKAGIRWQF